MNNPIICGFAGIGKSYVGRNCAGYIDLESTPFKKNWDLYTDVALHMQKQGYHVMVSCHKELRDCLKSKNADYIVAIPSTLHRLDYIERYIRRGNSPDFIKLLHENFDKWINEILVDEKLTRILVVDDYLKNSQLFD